MRVDSGQGQSCGPLSESQVRKGALILFAKLTLADLGHVGRQAFHEALHALVEMRAVRVHEDDKELIVCGLWLRDQRSLGLFSLSSWHRFRFLRLRLYCLCLDLRVRFRFLLLRCGVLLGLWFFRFDL